MENSIDYEYFYVQDISFDTFQSGVTYITNIERNYTYFSSENIPAYFNNITGLIECFFYKYKRFRSQINSKYCLFIITNSIYIYY